MKLKDYAKAISKLAKKYPNALVVSASDEEGNSYSEVIYKPTVGNFNEDTSDWDNSAPINSVCIN